MKRFLFKQKAISAALLLSLLLFLNPGVSYADDGGVKKPAGPGWSGTQNDRSGTGFVETSEPETKVKAKRFPWLPVIGLVLAAGAAAIYFLVLKDDSDDEEGFRDDFTGAASPLWRPRSPSLWTVGGDVYRCFASAYNFSEYNYVDRTFNSDDLVIEARLRQTTGDIGQYQGVFFVTGMSMTSVSGFEFRIYTNMLSQGSFSIARYNNANLTSINPVSTVVAAYTHHAAIGGDQSWNTVRIVRAGNTYSYYCNGVLLHSFSDASLDPAVAGLRLWSDADPHRLECDFFSIEI